MRPILGGLRRRWKTSRSSGPIQSTSGSWLLTHELYRKDTAYRERVANTLNNPDCFPEEIFDRARIKETWNEYLAGNIDRHFEIASLLTYGTLQQQLGGSFDL